VLELLKDGRYRIRLYSDGRKAGRRTQTTLPHGTTKEEAQAYYLRRLAEAAARRGTILPAFWTVEALIGEYIESQAHRLADSTQVSYKSSSIHLKAILGTIRLDRLRPADVQNYQRIRMEAKASPHTVNREVGFLKAVVVRAVAQGWLERSPLPPKSVTRMKGQPNRTRFFSPEEWKAFIEPDLNSDTFQRLSYPLRRRIPHLVPFWKTLLLTALRVREALALRGADVDWKAGRISLVQQKTKSVKHIPVSSVLREVLQALPKTLPSAPLFLDFDGAPLTYSVTRNTFDAARDLAGLPRDLLIHSIRHTAASWLVSSGVPIYTVSQLLGHTGPGMTAKYAHLSDGARIDAVETLGRIVSGKQAPPDRQQGATVSPFPLKQKDF
jgi:integrase